MDCTPYSEYPLGTSVPLETNFDLKCDSDALFVDGIGYIAQYHCYCDMMYSHGVIYFMRDMLFREIETSVERGTQSSELRTQIARLNALNSKIRVHEASQCHSQPPPPRAGPMPPTPSCPIATDLSAPSAP
jgi:hypothetical protein